MAKQSGNCHVISNDSDCSLATAHTETDIDSRSSESSWETDNVQRYKNDQEAESHIATDLSLESAASQGGQHHLMDFVDTSKLSQLDEEGIQSILPQGASVALIKKLLVKIERMERENEDLRALHHASSERICGFTVDNTGQVSRVGAFKQGQTGSICKTGPEQASSMHGRGSFFGFMRSDALHSERPSKSAKARVTS